MTLSVKAGLRPSHRPRTRRPTRRPCPRSIPAGAATTEVGASAGEPRPRRSDPAARAARSRRTSRLSDVVRFTAEPRGTASQRSSADDELWSGHSRLAGVLGSRGHRRPGLLRRASRSAPPLGIILVLSVQSFEFFIASKVGILEFLFGTELKPDADPPEVRDRAADLGDVRWSPSGSSCIALPIGLLSAIYLSEYAPRQVAGRPQADPRAAGGHPDDRLRLPRPAAGDAGPEAAASSRWASGSRQFNALSRLHRGRA